MKNDKNVGIGAIDCDVDKATCAKYGVNGYPTIKAIVGGKGKSYNGAREAEPIKEWISKVAANRGSKGGSSKCAQGVFKSKVKDNVVPLCEEHFPDEKAKNDWLVVFYDSKSSDATTIKNVANSLGAEFGNDPPDMNKALKTKNQKKKRDRLTELAKTHGLKLKLPVKGPFGMDALVKVGAVCCDCNEDASAFCASSLRVGEEELKAPQAFWVSKGKRNILKGVEITAKGLAQVTALRLGFAEKAANTEL